MAHHHHFNHDPALSVLAAPAALSCAVELRGKLHRAVRFAGQQAIAATGANDAAAIGG
jgi:hypothetical protein